MKKVILVLFILLLSLTSSGFSYEEEKEERAFSIDDLYDYQKEFKSEEIDVCASNSSKTYMDYRATTARDSRQYWFIREELTVDEQTGFLFEDELQLSKYMLQLYQLKDLRQNFGEQARQNVLQYGLDYVQPMVMRVYEENM